MSALEEITKEKQRISEALAPYSKGTQPKKAASAMTPTTATNATTPARSRGRPRATTATAASGNHSSPSLADQVLALAIGKTQQEIAAACKGARPNHVGSAICGTSGLAASKSAMGSSTARS